MKQHSNGFYPGPAMIQPVRNGANGNDASLFSSSLPLLPHQKCNLDLLRSGDARGNGALLPDDEDELLAGIMDGFDSSRLRASLEGLDDYDLFGSGGGMELELEQRENLSFGVSKLNLSDGVAGNGMVGGEHPYGEHPSRTLFVRNINSSVEDSELKAVFEEYGDIRDMYTACKHRGFVMISYYDIRAARTALRMLQNKPLRRRKLDIHFSIPKDNPSGEDMNQGTLVVFNLDPSVSNEDIRQIFGVYGEVKEVRETPYKRHHKFVEFYDVRAAEAALKQLNRRDIAGKRIKLEPSRPGGSHRNLLAQLNQEPEQDGNSSFRNWVCFNSPKEHNPLHGISKSPVFRSMSLSNSSHVSGLASILHSQGSNHVKVAPIGREHGKSGPSPLLSGAHLQQYHSLPASKLSQHHHPTMSSFGTSTSDGSVVETLSGPQFLWGSHKKHSPFSGGQGSAPSKVPLERHFGFLPDSPESSFVNRGSFGGIGSGPNDRDFRMNIGARCPPMNGVNVLSRTIADHHMMSSSSGFSPVFSVSSPRSGFASPRSRHIENNAYQVEAKTQFHLDLDRILSGEDTRTTLMIKNIPNKYTSKMLLAAIDERHSGTYDFLYLPIDFKNKCNVGYAFINMLSPSHIVPFYETFDGKKWEKFNSEKIASLAYARIQGKAALVSHFQNSSLMNEDKRCRPILFHSEGGTELDGQFVQERVSRRGI